MGGKSNRSRGIRKFGNPRRKKGEVWTNKRNKYHKSDNLLESEWPSFIISSSPAYFVLEDVNKVDSSDLAWFLKLLWSASASSIWVS